MKKISQLILSVIIILTATFAHSGEDKEISHYDCDKAQTQNEINKCLKIQFQEAERKLNEVYDKVDQHSDSERQKLLKKAQDSWTQFREANCAVERDMTRVKDNPLHGSMSGMLYYRCKERMTRQRTDELLKIEPMN